MVEDKMIVALDFETSAEAIAMVEKLESRVSRFKIGTELWSDPNRGLLLERLNKINARILLDLKIHDIPEIVSRAVHKIVSTYDVEMLTVLGYPRTIEAAVKGSNDRTQIMVVNLLTSDSGDDLTTAGYLMTKDGLMGMRTDYAVVHGAQGMVCAADDAKRIRNFSQGSLKIITPGIRLPGEARQDQRRVATPYDALRLGADHYVVGRPITRSTDPLATVERFLENASGHNIKKDKAT